MSQKSLRSAPRGGTRPRVGIANPASVYARDQGFTETIVTAPDGSQSGVITVNGQTVNTWDYYRENYVRPTVPVPEHSTGLILPGLPTIIRKKKLLPSNPIIRRRPTVPVPEHSTGLILPGLPTIIRKKKLLPSNPIIRRSGSPMKKVISSPSFQKKLKKVTPQSTKEKPKEKVIDIKKLMGEEKRSFFFS